MKWDDWENYLHEHGSSGSQRLMYCQWYISSDLNKAVLPSSWGTDSCRPSGTSHMGMFPGLCRTEPYYTCESLKGRNREQCIKWGSLKALWFELPSIHQMMCTITVQMHSPSETSVEYSLYVSVYRIYLLVSTATRGCGGKTGSWGIDLNVQGLLCSCIPQSVCD